MKVQEDRNTQKVDQYGTSFTIWLMGQGLFALDGEASSSRTSPCPVLWYIVRNSSHPQTIALEDKSGKQNHLRAQDVLPVHPVPTIWSRSSSTCKTAMVETCKPYFAKVLQSNSYNHYNFTLRRCMTDSGIIHMSMKGINALVAFRCI